MEILHKAEVVTNRISVKELPNYQNLFLMLILTLLVFHEYICRIEMTVTGREYRKDKISWFLYKKKVVDETHL